MFFFSSIRKKNSILIEFNIFFSLSVLVASNDISLSNYKPQWSDEPYVSILFKCRTFSMCRNATARENKRKKNRGKHKILIERQAHSRRQQQKKRKVYFHLSDMAFIRKREFARHTHTHPSNKFSRRKCSMLNAQRSIIIICNMH